jgi:hypothetical protein
MSARAVLITAPFRKTRIPVDRASMTTSDRKDSVLHLYRQHDAISSIFNFLAFLVVLVE